MPRTSAESPWRPLRWPALLSVGVLTYGVLGYALLLGWSFLDALYMTVLTMTTVGFREVRPLDANGKMFTITLLVLGASLLLLTLTIGASVLQEGRVAERFRRRRMQRRVESLSDHFIVAGYGRVGRTVAETLHREGVSFLIVDKSESRERSLLEANVPYMLGDATLEADLEAAGLHRARALICAVDDDADNIFIAMVARSLNPELYIVARASQAAAEVRLRTAGANAVFSPYVSGGREMAIAAIKPGVVEIMDIDVAGAPSVRVEELHVRPGSELSGRNLGDVRERGTPLVIRRAGGELLLAPDDDVTLEDGDLLIVLGTAPGTG